MECHKCGAHLPVGTYGQVKCEFCNTLNYVPVPGEKPGVAEKVGAKEEVVEEKKAEPIEEVQKPEPIIPEKTVKPSSKRSVLKTVVILLIIFGISILIFTIYSRQTKTAGERLEAATRATTYSTPALTTTLPTTTALDLSKIKSEFNALDFDLYLNADGGPAHVSGYITVQNDNDESIVVKTFCKPDFIEETQGLNCGGSSATGMKAHTNKDLEFSVATGTDTISGLYTGKIQLKAYKLRSQDPTRDSTYVLSRDVEDGKVQGEIIDEALININVNCATGCCDSGKYFKRDCN